MKLEAVQCPQCGAGIKINPNEDVVNCNFCKLSSFVTRGNTRTHTRTGVYVGDGQFTVNHADQQRYGHVHVQRGSPVAAIIVVFGMMVSLAITGVVVFLSMAARPTNITIGGPNLGGNNENPGSDFGLNLINKEQDLLTVVEKARQTIALQEPNPYLVSVKGLSCHHGKSKNTTVMIGYNNPKPDKSQNKGVFTAVNALPPMRMNGMGIFTPRPFPTCSSVKAWQVAVQSGIPDNAVATIEIAPLTGINVGRNNAPAAPSPIHWVITVDGHPEHRRVVNAQTCGLVR
jgi:hypothetical protein